jgi:hypothetical protein
VSPPGSPYPKIRGFALDFVPGARTIDSPFDFWAAESRYTGLVWDNMSITSTQIIRQMRNNNVSVYYNRKQHIQ